MPVKLQRFLAGAFLLPLYLTAQQDNGFAHRGCGTSAPSGQWDSIFNEKVREFTASMHGAAASSANYVIPVIVHVIHSGEDVGKYPNVTAAQVYSQLRVLNADYGGTGYKVSKTPAVFASRVANTNISFCPATRDPQGNLLPEAGIRRIDYKTLTNVNPVSHGTQTSFMNYMDKNIKPKTIWDPSRYLNIWVSDVNVSTLLLGYATFPPGSTLTDITNGTGSYTDDGVWLYARAFGNTGFVNYPYNEGRTATHEIGHYFGLRHIWGDGTDCSNNTDYCNDTPPQKNSHFGCPKYPQTSCNNGSLGGDMFMNFMDYCDDSCCFMFTPDQAARMHTALSFSSLRKNLTSSAASLCDPSPQMPVAGFSFISEGCRDTIFATSNQSSGSPAPSYVWYSSPSTASFFPSNSVPDPEIVFSGLGQYTVTLLVSTMAGNSDKKHVVSVIDCSPEAGINDHSRQLRSVQIFPNPSDGMVEIQLELEGASDVLFEISNALGQRIWSLQKEQAVSGVYQLSPPALSEGFYFVRVTAGHHQSVKRLIIRN